MKGLTVGQFNDAPLAEHTLSATPAGGLYSKYGPGGFMTMM